jgi:hypothetical protein
LNVAVLTAATLMPGRRSTDYFQPDFAYQFPWGERTQHDGWLKNHYHG